MVKHELSLNEEINLYSSSGLTPTELFVFRLLHLAFEGDSELLIKYISNTGGGSDLLIVVLQSLVDKKVIKNSFKVPNKGDTLDFRKIPFNKNFINKYIKESHTAGKEFFDAYPPFINIRGKMCSIKNITKARLYSMEEFCFYYNKAIKTSKVTHSYVMNRLEFAKENELISYSITEFIASRKWQELEVIENSGDINGYKNSELI